ncbi:MAG: Uncharacterised protein [Cyanobium sp. ARS6]|nr:MAG: Uncharacterised protein [Cyanobium sp. ARS6]
MEITTEKHLIADVDVVHRISTGLADLVSPGVELLASVFSGAGTEGFGVGATEAAPLGGAASKGLFQSRSTAVPFSEEVLPAALQPTFKNLAKSLIRIDRLRILSDTHRTVTIQSLKCRSECFGRQACLQQSCNVPRFKLQDLRSPEIMGDLDGQGLWIIIQGKINGLTVLKRLPAKAAAAEAMDRGDVGSLQGFEGLEQPTGKQSALLGIPSVLFKPVLQDFVRFRQRRSAPFLVQEALQRRIKSASDPVAQFIGRGLSESHHQQLIEAQSLFRHQSQHEVGQGEGFPCSSACLQESNAGRQWVGIGFESSRASSCCHRHQHRASSNG